MKASTQNEAPRPGDLIRLELDMKVIRGYVNGTLYKTWLASDLIPPPFSLLLPGTQRKMTRDDLL